MEFKERHKIQEIDNLGVELQRLKAMGRVVVQCHGVFDVLHVGHIWHLQEAKKRGDVLVVTLTPDEYVNKGPHRPAFREELRVEMLAALDVVDFVTINKWPTAVEAIKLLMPDFYVKGPDYSNASDDRTGKIQDEELAIRSVGGEIYFTEGKTYSSSVLINQHLSAQSDEAKAFVATIRDRYSVQDIAEMIEDLKNARVLVVGEAIIDEYQYCEAIGKSSKEPTLVVKVGKKDLFAGGVLAITNHIAGLAGATGVVTLLGDRNGLASFAQESIQSSVAWRGVTRNNVSTIVKRRYVDNYFFTKLFETYDLSDEPLPADDESKLIDIIEKEAGQYDAVLVADYGHEFFTDKIIASLKEQAHFLAVNVQSNAGSLGYQSLQKYAGADFFSIDEAEARLEARDKRGDIESVVQSIGKDAGAKTMFVTRGKHGSICFRPDAEIVSIPAVAGKIVDRVGAGDAFLAVSTLCLRRGVPVEVAGFLGNIAGAMVVATVANKKPVTKLDLVRCVESLLK